MKICDVPEKELESLIGKRVKSSNKAFPQLGTIYKVTVEYGNEKIVYIKWDNGNESSYMYYAMNNEIVEE